MKPLLLAAALLLTPVTATPALAQVSAGAVPNTFDRPAQAPTAAPAPAPAPANAASESTLRAVIAAAQAGAMDYTLMTPDLAAKVREQEATVTPLIQSFGAVQSVAFAGNQGEADLFNVTFANAATQWLIGFDDAGKVAALLFRPAE